MPYKDAEDKSLPENVQALPDNLKAQWVAVFNSAYQKAIDEGKDPADAETAAFAQAWGVVNKAKEDTAADAVQEQAAEADPAPEEEYPEEAPAAPADAPAEPSAEAPMKLTLDEVMKVIQDALKKLLGIKPEAEPEAGVEQSKRNYLKPDPTCRAMNIMTIIDKVMVQVTEEDPLAGVLDFFYDETAGMSAIISSQGKLYSVPITLKGSTVTTGAWKELGVTQSRKPSFAITRTKEGKYRWISVSATSVLNRDGEIDSRELFDSFIRYAEATGEYPIRCFYHAGGKFRTGQCDFLARDENCLVTSGLYDDSELAMREVIARSEHPEFWGDSIAFDPTEPVQQLRVSKGVTIPVYVSGILREISTLPENEAAGWFTAKTTITEVQRMLNEKQMRAFVQLFGSGKDAEAEAKRWLKENSAERNRQIIDQSLITRAKRELEALQATAAAAVPEIVTVTEADRPQPEADPVDAVVARVKETLDIPGAVTGAVTEAIKPLSEEITRMSARIKAVEDVAVKFTGATQEAQVAQADAVEQARKHREWFADLPAAKPIVRPSVARNANTSKAPLTESSETAAKRVLDTIPVKY